MSRPVTYHPMETAPRDGSTIRLKIRPPYVGCPTEVFGSFVHGRWMCDTPLDSSRDIQPTGWAEL